MVTPGSPGHLGAVVLSGGTGRRLGGADKAGLRLSGRSLLDHALEATAAADATVVVGPPTPTSREVTWTREQPAGGGPAAGLLAGLAALPPAVDTVLFLAVDMPAVRTGTFERLLTAAAEHDGAVLVGRDDRRQLAGVLRRSRVAAPPGDPEGLPMHRLLAGLDLCEVPALGDESVDVDTWDELERLSQLADALPPQVVAKDGEP